MLAARGWARADLRRRWQALVVLAVLGGIVGGIVLTTVAGARRSNSAYQRYREETLASDLDITLLSDPSPESFERISELPQVEVLSVAVYPFIVPEGSGLYPYLDFLALAPLDDAFGRTIDRPRLVDGRMPAADRADEMAITERFADEAGLGPGDRLGFEAYAPDQVEALFATGGAGSPTGPSMELQVTGIVAAPVFLSDSQAAFQPRVFLARAFVERHGGQVGAYEGGAHVRLRRGFADLPATMAAVRELFADDQELELMAATELDARIEDTLDVVVTGLLVVAACAALVGMVTAGQALRRHIDASVDAVPTLAHLGMTRGQRTVALWLPMLLAAVVVGGLAVAVAVVASPLMPIGLARRAEPDPGLSIDGVVLVVGGLGAVVVVAALALVVAWLAAGVALVAGTGAAGAPRRRTSVPLLVNRLGLAASATVGIGLAFDRGSRRAVDPVRSALAGSVVGIAGLVAAVVFASSLATLERSPHRYGFPWHAIVSGFGGEMVEANSTRLTDDVEVEALASLRTSLVRVGDEDVNVHAFRALKGVTQPTVLEGRMPASPDEVVVGSATPGARTAGIGGQIEVLGATGAERLTVVGRVAVPIVDERSSVERGLFVTEDALDAMVAPDTVNHDLVIRWGPEVPVDEALADLTEATGAEVSGVRPPSDVSNLGAVGSLPRAAAALLAALAGLALVHSVLTTNRRHRRELAVLRTVGLSDRGLSRALAWQASTFTVACLLIGVPLGAALGSLAWRGVADAIGVVNTPTYPVLVVGALVVAAVVAGNLAAAVTARRIRSATPAAALRAG